jgi:hypothetical protein
MYRHRCLAVVGSVHSSNGSLLSWGNSATRVCSLWTSNPTCAILIIDRFLLYRCACLQKVVLTALAVNLPSERSRSLHHIYGTATARHESVGQDLRVLPEGHEPYFRMTDPR